MAVVFARDAGCAGFRASVDHVVKVKSRRALKVLPNRVKSARRCSRARELGSGSKSIIVSVSHGVKSLYYCVICGTPGGLVADCASLGAP